MINPTQKQPEPRAARLAVLIVFFVNGSILGSWVPHIPLVQERLELSEGLLGLALLGMAVGALMALVLSGWLITRVGSRLVTSIAVLALCAVLPLPALAPSLPLLVLALLLFGASNGALDVAMNAQGVTVEKRYPKPIMSSFHGFFSLGGLAGAALSGLVLARGLSPEAHVLFSAVGFGIMGLVALRWLLPKEAEAVVQGPTFIRPTGALVGLGVLAFFTMLGEGAVMDWSAVYLRNVLGTDAGLAAAGFAAFSFAMAVGRLTGDALVTRFGPVPLLRASATLAAAGLGFALLIGHPLAAIIGFGSVGLGLANLIPVLFSAAGRTPGVNAGVGIAAVATTGYFGFLAGPPLIGFAAELISLPGALGLVVVFIATVAGFAYLAQRADAEDVPETVGRGLLEAEGEL